MTQCACLPARHPDTDLNLPPSQYGSTPPRCQVSGIRRQGQKQIQQTVPTPELRWLVVGGVHGSVRSYKIDLIGLFRNSK